ncbi:MAG: DNA polymerase III subunit delta' [Flavobacteriaceae bacterium]|nr:DNA polymerase III subunit delta' [Flavobacteriaceae bacterium]
MNLHTALQTQLLQAISTGKISHALIFHGKCGYGTLPLALWYAEKLLCQGGNENCAHKVRSLQHADLNFVYPVATTEEVKKDPVSADFRNYWSKFVSENPYGDGFDWMQFIGGEKKQGIINVAQAKEILKTLSLRSYEGGYKIMMIWLPETMNADAANKLLKVLEEPPQKTVFLLISESPEKLLSTILSRCQLIKVPRLGRLEVEEILIQQFDAESNLAAQAAKNAKGDVSLGLENLLFKSEVFEELFIQWVRAAFKAKKDVSALQEIFQWSQQIAGWNNREQQKKFLSFCIDIFRQALMQNYGLDDLVFNQIKSENFKWPGFVKFIHSANIEEILHEINLASMHIERNANAKIVFLDLGIKMTRLIHAKEKIEEN